MKYILLLFVVSTSFAYGQNRLTLETSAEIIVKAYTLQTEEKYEDAILEYSRININDTNYAVAQYETGTCLVRQEDYKKARKVLRSLLEDEVKFDFQNDVYTSIGYSYLQEGDTLNALKTYNEGIKLYPMDYLLYYNRGIANEGLGNYQEAYTDYVNSIQRNIYYPSSHYRIGMMAANEEHYAEAMLSMMTYLLIDPASSSAASVISFVESIANGSFNPEPKEVIFSESNPFESVNLLFKNRVALENKYKAKFTISGAYPRQLHFIVNNQKYDENDMDFWNQFYLPVYLKINEQKKLDQLVLLSLVSVENDEIQKKIKPNISKIKSFLEWVKPVYTDLHTFQYLDYEGKATKVFTSYENKKLVTFGPLNSENLPHGNFYYFHENGSPMLKAKYEEGEPVEKFEYYNSTNEKKFRQVEFTGGKGNKIESYYYYSGELKEVSTYKNDLIEDTVFEYFRNGTLKEVISVLNNKRHGVSISYFPNGTIKSKGNYKNGEPDGKFENYHRNGKLESEYSFVNAMREGTIKSYYADGTIASVYEVKADKYNGPYEEFYPNGTLSEKGMYKNGINVSGITYYFSNGTLKNTTTLDDNGKENGSSVLYDLDGKKYHEIDYSSGDIKQVRFFDKEGKMKVVADKKGKKINYQFYYPSGALNFEGKIEDGNKEGPWTYYDRYGNISKTEKYVKGVVTDTVNFYFPNGQLSNKIVYVDGSRNGLFVDYSIYGDLIREGFYKDDEFDREMFSYYPDGSIESEEYYMNGELHGYQKHYAVNGKLKMIQELDEGFIIRHNYYDTLGNEMDVYGEYNGFIALHDPLNTYVNYTANFLNGEANGEQTFLTPEKTAISKGIFSNGYRSGKWQWFYNDGKLSEEANYINGDINGVNTEYHHNGKPSYILNYQYGYKQGEFKSINENGKVTLEGNYLDDERHGIVSLYSPDGGVILLRDYNLGVITSYSYLGPDGKPVPYIPITKDADSIVTYYKNKNIAMRSKRTNGLIEGIYLTQYENGQVYQKEEYLHDNNHGFAVKYHPNGKVSSECNYIKGYKDGVEKTYHSNGNLKSTQTFLNGSAHGELKEYTIEGKLVTTTTYYDGEIITIKRH